MQYALLSVLPLLFASALAQTWSLCNPLERDGCPNNPALSGNSTFNLTDFKLLDDKIWNITAGRVKAGEKGADLTIARQGESATVQSKFYMFGGIYSVVMRAAKGRGIVSSLVMQSDVLDEIDWEWIGGNNTHVQTNYFGKGNTTSYDRDEWHAVEDPQGRFVNYTVKWTQQQIEFYIDDDLVRTLVAQNADNGGKNYPQTPMDIRFGIWAGGDPTMNSEFTVDWAGGEVNWDEAPFTMTVASIYAQDFSTGKEYQYGDRSGDWNSIKVIEGESATMKRINEPKGVSGRWNALPQAARIGIVAGAVGGFALAVIALLWFCIKQRRQGRREHARLLEEDATAEQERLYWKDKVDHSPNAPLGHR